MPYKAILKELVDKVPGSVGAILVDWEGEAVQEHCHCGQYEIRFVAAHKGILLSRLRELRSQNQGWDIESVMVTTSSQMLLIGAIDKDYSLVLQVERSRPLAVARHHFDRMLVRLRREL